MEASASDVLNRGRSLFADATQERSVALPRVTDPFDNTVIESWRQAPNGSHHALHRIMSRVGGFPPHLSRYFIAKYSSPGDLVADPFCGKGTTVFEAASRGRVAVGGDVAPEAVIVTRAKTSRVTIADVVRYIEDLPGETTSGNAPTDVALFFNRTTLRELLAIRERLLEDIQRRDARGRLATFVCGVLLGILHGHSRFSLSLPCNQCFGMSPAYVRRYVKEHRLQRPRRDVKRCLIEKTLEFLPAPKKLGSAFVYEHPAQTCHHYLCRFRSKVRLVVTSPPYLHRQTYLKDAWLRLWFLDRETTGIAPVSLETASVTRFLDGMECFLRSLGKVLEHDARVVLVCGRANGTVAAKKREIRVAEVCLHAIDRLNDDGLPYCVESIISDRKLMKRGSYYAVHAGRSNGKNGKRTQRYGEDEIIILQYVG